MFLLNNLKNISTNKINFICFILSFAICFLLNNFGIKLFNNLYLIQNSKNISKYLDKNVPTMGGIFILLSIIITMLITININCFSLIILYSIISYGFVGFIDDFIKINKKNKNYYGISITNKCLILLILSYIIYILVKKLLYYNNIINIIYIPILGFRKINIKIINLIIYFALISTCNSTNISDGLDGLLVFLISNIIISYIFIINFILNNNLLNFIYINDLLNICYIIFGSLISFLWFNCYPSNIFMGDIGSLSLGSLISLIFIFLRNELMIIPLGILLIIELFSVIVQIIYFKIFNLRFFKMAPIHHHYQLKNINESKIVSRFLILSIIFNLFSILIIYFK